MRLRASRGEFACSVPIDPSWPCVHCLQQIKSLGPTNLSYDDPFRPHPQAVLDQLAHADLAVCLRCWAGAFPGVRHAVAAIAAQPSLRRSRSVLHRRHGSTDNSSSVVLPDPVPPDTSTLHRVRPMMRRSSAPLLCDRAKFDQFRQCQLVFLELANCERRTINRQRRRDYVDPTAVQQAGIADRAGFIDTPPDLARRSSDRCSADAADFVLNRIPGLFNLAIHLDENIVGPIDHDVRDVIARQQVGRVDRTPTSPRRSDATECPARQSAGTTSGPG